jgi:hypothetical protein
VVPLVVETKPSAHILHLLLAFCFMVCFIVFVVKGFRSVFPDSSPVSLCLLLCLSCVCVCACARMRIYVRTCARACKSNCTDTTTGDRTLTAPEVFSREGTKKRLKARCHGQMFDFNIRPRFACAAWRWHSCCVLSPVRDLKCSLLTRHILRHLTA